jgi:hypothetical protein
MQFTLLLLFVLNLIATKPIFGGSIVNYVDYAIKPRYLYYINDNVRLNIIDKNNYASFLNKDIKSINELNLFNSNSEVSSNKRLAENRSIKMTNIYRLLHTNDDNSLLIGTKHYLYNISLGNKQNQNENKINFKIYWPRSDNQRDINKRLCNSMVSYKIFLFF